MAGDYSKETDAPGDDDLPVVQDVTVTQPDTESAVVRLASFLSQKPGGSTAGMIDVVSQIERLFAQEGNEEMKCRLASARACLLAEKDTYSEKKGY